VKQPSLIPLQAIFRHELSEPIFGNLLLDLLLMVEVVTDGVVYRRSLQMRMGWRISSTVSPTLYNWAMWQMEMRVLLMIGRPLHTPATRTI